MTTSCSGLWKNTVRFFVTPYARCKQCNKPDKARCWRDCGNIKAGHFHIFWHCDGIAPYWSEVIKVLQSILGPGLPMGFTEAYLGNLPQGMQKLDKYLLLLAVAKKAITRRWLCKDYPVLKDWIQVVNEIYDMERLTFSLRLSVDKCNRYCEKWLSYIKNVGN